MSLEWPLVSLEPFLFVGRAALDRLCQRLESRGFACQRLELELRLEPDGHQTRSVVLPAPTRDVKTLLTLVRLELEARPPGAPVAGFTFLARPDRPREAQLSLYGPAALSPDKLATTLARLFALLGPDRVGSPRPVDGHRPERFALVDFAPPPPPGGPPRAARRPRPPRRPGAAAAGRARGDLTNGAPEEPEAAPVEVRALVSEEAKRPRDRRAGEGRLRSLGAGRRLVDRRSRRAATTGTWSSPAAGSTGSTANGPRATGLRTGSTTEAGRKENGGRRNAPPPEGKADDQPWTISPGFRCGAPRRRCRAGWRRSRR